MLVKGFSKNYKAKLNYFIVHLDMKLKTFKGIQIILSKSMFIPGQYLKCPNASNAKIIYIQGFAYKVFFFFFLEGQGSQNFFPHRSLPSCLQCVYIYIYKSLITVLFATKNFSLD